MERPVISFGCGRERLPELTALYNDCFDDGAAYADLLFSRRIDLSLAAVAEVGGAIAGAFYFIPLTVCGKKGVMLYALGVTPAQRGRGIASQLLDFAGSYCEKNGLACLIRPADNGLFALYERHGFTRRIRSKLSVYHGSEFGLPVRTITADEYHRRREEYLSGLPAVCWNADDVGYAVLENAFCGGLCIGGDRFVALLRRERGKAVICELLTDRYDSPAYLKRCALAAGSMCGFSDVSAVFPAWFGDGVPFSSSLAFNLPTRSKDLYFGLMLD